MPLTLFFAYQCRQWIWRNDIRHLVDPLICLLTLPHILALEIRNRDERQTLTTQLKLLQLWLSEMWSRRTADGYQTAKLSFRNKKNKRNVISEWNQAANSIASTRHVCKQNTKHKQIENNPWRIERTQICDNRSVYQCRMVRNNILCWPNQLLRVVNVSLLPPLCVYVCCVCVVILFIFFLSVNNPPAKCRVHKLSSYQQSCASAMLHETKFPWWKIFFFSVALHGW